MNSNSPSLGNSHSQLQNENQATKKVTYDDILSSLNMQVVNGKLQIVRNRIAENIKAGNLDPSQAANFKPIVKQSTQTIPQQQEQHESPILTPEQQKRMKQIHALNMLNNMKKQEEQKKRVQATKSTKLQFSN
jgi:hypothetical protein